MEVKHLSLAQENLRDLAEEQWREGLRREFISDPDETTEFDDGVAIYKGVPVEVTDPDEAEFDRINATNSQFSSYSTLMRRIDTETFEDVAQEVYDEAFNLLVARQEKYGPKNIAEQGVFGVFNRIEKDKMQRIKRAFNGAVVKGEVVLDEIDMGGEEGDTLEDALLDVANYALIILLLLRGRWGKPLAKEVGFDS